MKPIDEVRRQLRTELALGGRATRKTLVAEVLRVLPEKELLELLDELMAMLRVPAWVRAIARKLAKGLIPGGES